ncbi:MAG TPA: hypothetical protein VHB54_06055 [Mucilaginibacter sp.]|nr:hypothetical protein [Mucilaginibacter sp.]
MKTGKNKGEPIEMDTKRATPQRLSQPSYKPFFLALGLIFIFRDLLKDWVDPPVQVKQASHAKIETVKDEHATAEPEGERALPHRLPKPTYWPFFAALGLTFIFWGLLTTWVILLAGFVILAIAFWGWINILRHE